MSASSAGILIATMSGLCQVFGNAPLFSAR